MESPTGTGKTLALLTSTLSFQAQDYQSRFDQYEAHFKESSEANQDQKGCDSPRSPHKSPRRKSTPASTATTSPRSPLATAIEDTGTSALEIGRQKALQYKKQLAEMRSPTSVQSPSPDSPMTTRGTKLNSPTPVPKEPRKTPIFFTTRTHSQIEQVIAELRNCPSEYTNKLNMTVLGSRNLLCVNKPKDQPGIDSSLDKHCKDLGRLCKYRDGDVRVAASLGKKMVWGMSVLLLYL